MERLEHWIDNRDHNQRVSENGVWFKTLMLEGFGPFYHPHQFQFKPGINIFLADNERGKSSMLAGIVATIFGLSHRQKSPVYFTLEQYRNWQNPFHCRGELVFISHNNTYKITRDFDRHQVELWQQKEGKFYSLLQGQHNIEAKKSFEAYEEKIFQLLGLGNQDLFWEVFLVRQPLPEARELSAGLQVVLSGSQEVSLRGIKDYFIHNLKKITKYTGANELGITLRNGSKNGELEIIEQQVQALQEQIFSQIQNTDSLEQINQAIQQGEQDQKTVQLAWKQNQSLEKAFDTWLILKEKYQEAAQQRNRLEAAVKEAYALEKQVKGWEDQQEESYWVLATLAKDKPEIDILAESTFWSSCVGQEQEQRQIIQGLEQELENHTRHLQAIEKILKSNAASSGMENRLWYQMEELEGEVNHYLKNLHEIYGLQQKWKEGKERWQQKKNAPMDLPSQSSKDIKNARPLKGKSFLEKSRLGALGFGIGGLISGLVGAYVFELTEILITGLILLGGGLGAFLGWGGSVLFKKQQRRGMDKSTLAEATEAVPVESLSTEAKESLLLDQFETYWKQKAKDVLGVLGTVENLDLIRQEPLRQENSSLQVWSLKTKLENLMQQESLASHEDKIKDKIEDKIDGEREGEGEKEQQGNTFQDFSLITWGDFWSFLSRLKPSWWQGKKQQLEKKATILQQYTKEKYSLQLKTEQKQKEEQKLQKIIQEKMGYQIRLKSLWEAGFLDEKNPQRVIDQYRKWQTIETHKKEMLQRIRGICQANQVVGLADLVHVLAGLQDQTLRALDVWEKHIQAHSGLPSSSLSDAWENLHHHQAVLQKTGAELSFRLEQLEADLQDLYQKQARQEAKSPLNIAAAELEIKESLAQKNRLERRRNVLKLALENIEEAVNTYQQNYQSRLETSINAYIKTITKTSKRWIKLDGDMALELWEEGRKIHLSHISQGARDQIYLAMRWAMGDLLTEKIMLPFVWDDPFVTSDSNRLEQMKMIVKQQSKQRQFFILSCDPHYLSWGELVAIKTGQE